MNASSDTLVGITKLIESVGSLHALTERSEEREISLKS